MRDLKQLFSDLIRFETEHWSSVDAHMRAEHDLPLQAELELRLRLALPDRPLKQFSSALDRLRAAARLADSSKAA